MDSIVILHISDLHFGIENDPNSQHKQVHLRQKEMFSSLIDTLKNIDGNWKPNVIAISGDIAWSGEEEEYSLYKEHFVNPVNEVFGIDENHIITCPGNHDLIRNNAANYIRPSPNVYDSDISPIMPSNINDRKKHFEGYINKLYGGDFSKLFYSKTYEEFPWVSFLSLNSAWDCRNDNDEGRLRVSLPILENLLDNLPQKDNYVITLFHHPHREVFDSYETIDSYNHIREITHKKRCWLHISELEDGSPSRCFSSRVEEKSTFILNGHIHKETKPQKLNKSIQLISGTIYSNDTINYHCRLLKLSIDKSPCYRDLRHNLNDDQYEWEITNPKLFNFDHIAIMISQQMKEKAQKELFSSKLISAVENYDNNKNIDSFRNAIITVASELLREIPLLENSIIHLEDLSHNRSETLDCLYSFNLSSGDE